MQAIADHFGISGEVTSVRVVSKGPGQTKAWVEYQTPQQAITAREHDQTVSLPQLASLEWGLNITNLIAQTCFQPFLGGFNLPVSGSNLVGKVYAQGS